jgi:hypothetical protein
MNPIEEHRMLVIENSIHRYVPLSELPGEFRHPTEEDVGKTMYWNTGRWAGKFEGFRNDVYGDVRVTYSYNEKLSEFTNPPDHMYVYINPPPPPPTRGPFPPPPVGGKLRRRYTKKSRRGKSKRRGRKTRGQRR